MSRSERKGAVVERVTHPKTKLQGTIRLDKRTMTFFARLPDEDRTLENAKTRKYIESKNGDEVRRWLNEHLAKQDKAKALKWLPVIQVEVSERDGDYYRGRRNYDEQERKVAMKVEIDRFYIALNPEQTEWLKLEWSHCDDASSHHIEPEDRLVQASNFRHGPKYVASSSWHSDKPFKLPSMEGTTSFVAYTPELWAGLNEVLDRLESSRKTLEELLSTKKGMALLAEVGKGQLRLGSGDISPQKEVEA